ncbi:nitroreductase/quinone reductase family protein [Lentzea sp. NPDC060358]|uniref:nitroreductase/quinone reductase family protein n=1 Tax=Lentzea sp. NPDC060358 TaxID=3347103 RepID=UPI00365CBA8A
MTRSSSELNAQMITQIIGNPAQPVSDDGYALRVVETRGRVSGEAHRTPLGLTQVGGRQYLVCPDRRRDWVRNLRAHAGCTLLAGGEQQTRQAVGIGGEEAARVVSVYLAAVTAPWALKAFPVPPGASTAEIERHLDTMAVFRLDGGS